jgi:hypothetical protein
MELTKALNEWTPYETKAALIIHERRAEEAQLEQLQIRLRNKMREAELRAGEETAA